MVGAVLSVCLLAGLFSAQAQNRPHSEEEQGCCCRGLDSQTLCCTVCIVFPCRQHSAVLWAHPSRHIRNSRSWYGNSSRFIDPVYIHIRCECPTALPNPDATGEPWEYLNGRAVRNPGVLVPKPVFDILEWTVTENINLLSGYSPGSYAGADSLPPCTDVSQGSGGGVMTALAKKSVAMVRSIMRLPNRTACTASQPTSA